MVRGVGAIYLSVGREMARLGPHWASRDCNEKPLESLKPSDLSSKESLGYYIEDLELGVSETQTKGGG